MSSSLPRVAIVVPSGDMVHAAFAMAFAELCRCSGPLRLNLISVSSSIIAIARNNGVALAQAFDAEFLLFLDSDMVFPPTLLIRLLIHRRDVVGATYVKRVPPFDLLGTALADQPEDRPEGLLEMRRIPTGCLRIRMAVFGRLAKPYFRFQADESDGVIVGEDYVFCDQVREAGFRIWCDPVLSDEVGHIGQRIYRLSDADRHGRADEALRQNTAAAP